METTISIIPVVPGSVRIVSGTLSNGSSLSPSGLTSTQMLLTPPSMTASNEFLKPITTAVWHYRNKNCASTIT